MHFSHSQALIVQDGPLASLSGFLDHTHTDTRWDSSGRVISPSQRPLPTEDNTTYKHRQTSMPTAGFEHAIPATKQPQTYALDRAATGIGFVRSVSNLNVLVRIIAIVSFTSGLWRPFCCCFTSHPSHGRSVSLIPLDV
jgi:hypothetical protein